MLKRREVFARAFVLLILVALPTTVIGYKYELHPRTVSADVIEIHASSPERGGFSPNAIQVEAGQTVTLRFTSDDVTHGIAIGPGLGVDLGHVDPGQTKEVTLTFDKPGTYTFYCNTWCSRDHWRMRGVIDVRDPQGGLSTAVPDPVIQALIEEGLNIDGVHSIAKHDPDAFIWAESLSAERGWLLIDELNIPPELWDANWRMSHAPLDAFDLLEKVNPDTPQSELGDVIAYFWTLNANSADTTQAVDLYNKNCAACHGQNGNGDGFAAAFTAVIPAAFANPQYMLTMRRDVLYAKIRRGGMGTDMPNFGTLFTPEETWALVDYLWTFILQAEGETRPAHGS